MKTLYPPQQAAVLDLLSFIGEGSRYLALVGPTGCGKTLLTTWLLAHLTRVKRSGVRVAVVVVPNHDIAANYRNQGVIRFGTVTHVDGTVSTFPDMDLNAVVDLTRATRKLLRKHLQSADKKAPILVVNYNLLLTVLEDFEDLSDVMIVFDECHHTDDKGRSAWSKLRKMAQAKGAIVLGSSGTMFRADGSPVFEGADTHEIPLSELIALHLCPSEFPIHTTVLNWEAKEASEFFDESLEGCQSLLHKRLTEDDMRSGFELWIAEGCPKGMFKFPLIALAEQARTLFLKEFADRPEVKQLPAKGEILQAWGTDPKVKMKISATLETERKVKNYADSKIDLIFFCQRGQEGLDWPLCSHVYTFGLVYSPNSIMQLLGRTMRPKLTLAGEPRIAGYPERYLDYSSLRMFIGKMSADVEQEIFQNPRFRERMVLLGALLANHGNARLLALDAELRNALPTGLGGAGPRGGGGGGGGVGVGGVDVQMLAMVWLAKFEARLGRPLGLGDIPLLVGRASEVSIRVLKAALWKITSELPEDDRKTIIAQILEQLKGSTDEAWVEALAGVLSELCTEFPDFTVSFQDTICNSYGMLTQTSGETIKQLSSSLWGHILFRPASFHTLALAVHRSQKTRGAYHGRWFDLSDQFGLEKGTYTSKHVNYQLKHDRFNDQPEDVMSMSDLERKLRCQTL